MLEEYALVPDIFDSTAYTKPDYADMRLEDLKEPLLREALVRDLCDGGWSRHCVAVQTSMHPLTGELLRKLATRNRLCRFPRCGSQTPTRAANWCQEALNSHARRPLSGVIAADATKQKFAKDSVVCSIEKLTGTVWFQRRSPSRTVDRKTSEYLNLLDRVLRQANSLMFIDPNLNPQQHNYRDFQELLIPMKGRNPNPKIELHRSFCDGDGAKRRLLDGTTGPQLFAPLDTDLKNAGISAEVFLWKDFHDRYLITDIIGLTVGAGFDITTAPNDMTTWARLGQRDRDDIQRRFDPASRANDLKVQFTIGVV